eukprot:COSAG06_NODE_4554_length_4150_cov_1603.846989_3_plen_31_part_00
MSTSMYKWLEKWRFSYQVIEVERSTELKIR